MNLQSDQINELADALSRAQGSIETAYFDKVNPHFKSQYASYDSIRKACQRPLCENGLCITQMLQMTDKGRTLMTQLSHKSGQWMRSEMMLPTAERETPQAVGSSITYAKRYALAALLCIGTGDDDDGEQAEQPMRKEETKAVPIDPSEIDKIETEMANTENFKGMLLYYKVKSLKELSGEKLQEALRNLKRAKK